MNTLSRPVHARIVGIEHLTQFTAWIARAARRAGHGRPERHRTVCAGVKIIAEITGEQLRGQNFHHAEIRSAQQAIRIYRQLQFPAAQIEKVRRRPSEIHRVERARVQLGVIRRAHGETCKRGGHRDAGAAHLHPIHAVAGGETGEGRANTREANPTRRVRANGRVGGAERSERRHAAGGCGARFHLDSRRLHNDVNELGISVRALSNHHAGLRGCSGIRLGGNARHDSETIRPRLIKEMEIVRRSRNRRATAFHRKNVLIKIRAAADAGIVDVGIHPVRRQTSNRKKRRGRVCERGARGGDQQRVAAGRRGVRSRHA